MKLKQIVLCTLMIIVSCIAVFILSPSLMAKDEKPMPAGLGTGSGK